jgi:hypothetical protein
MRGKNMPKKKKKAPKGYHYMADGTLMKGATHNASTKKPVPRKPIEPRAATKKKKVKKKSGY